MKSPLTLRTAALLLAAAAWAPLPLAAQATALKLSISPLRVEFQLEPGAAYTDAAHVANDGLEPVRLEATVNDWTIDAQGSPVFLASGAPSPDEFACARWIRIAPEDFELGPGQMQRVRFTIQVPAGTPPMGCRAALLFTSAPPLVRPSGKQVLTQARLASIIYVRVGHPAVAGKVTGLELEPAPRPELDAPAAAVPDWQLAIAIRNSGQTYFRADGPIELLDAAGRAVANFSLDSQIVLPASERTFVFPFAAALGPGAYRLRATVDVGEPSLMRVEKSVLIGAAPATTAPGTAPPRS